MSFAFALEPPRGPEGTAVALSALSGRARASTRPRLGPVGGFFDEGPVGGCLPLALGLDFLPGEVARLASRWGWGWMGEYVVQKAGDEGWFAREYAPSASSAPSREMTSSSARAALSFSARPAPRQSSSCSSNPQSTSSSAILWCFK